MIYTGYFGALRKYTAAGLAPVSIAVSTPQWANVENRYPALAPDPWTLKWAEGKYTEAYVKKLARLDPLVVVDAMTGMGKDVIMLCWEKPGEFCHRRLVAEWIESETYIVIPEWGISEAKKPEQMSLF